MAKDPWNPNAQQFTVGLVSTPTPSHFSHCNVSPSTTFLTTPMQHFQFTLDNINPTFRKHDSPDTQHPIPSNAIFSISKNISCAPLSFPNQVPPAYTSRTTYSSSQLPLRVNVIPSADHGYDNLQVSLQDETCNSNLKLKDQLQVPQIDLDLNDAAIQHGYGWRKARETLLASSKNPSGGLSSSVELPTDDVASRQFSTFSGFTSGYPGRTGFTTGYPGGTGSTSGYPGDTGFTSRYPAGTGFTSGHPGGTGFNSGYPVGTGFTSGHPGGTGFTSRFPAGTGCASGYPDRAGYFNRITEEDEGTSKKQDPRAIFFNMDNIQPSNSPANQPRQTDATDHAYLSGHAHNVDSSEQVIPLLSHDTPLQPIEINSRLAVPEEDSTVGGSEGPGRPGTRLVYLNEHQPTRYRDNAISTAKYPYRLLFFLPMFLFEQFRRYANIFFFIIALLQQIPGISPTGRYTTMVPLICILVVSAIKEIAEDIKRHRADDEINNRQVEVLKDGQWQWVKWKLVKVGDILKIQNHKFFPADLILLASSEPQGLCYVETANLDGETNLKIRQALPQTSPLLEAKDLMNVSAKVECELPNRFLYQFTGNFKETSRSAVPLSPDQLLLRGAKLQNTNWVFGLVIYTGHETKLMKNSATSAPLKRSVVDKKTNQLIILMFFLLIILCLIMGIFNSQWNAEVHWYLAVDDLTSFNFGINFITFIILFNNLIPISLQVTLELVRFIQAEFINNDEQMLYEENNISAMARTSNLNEELGMVKYVLSDKTGTLTCNIMEFRRCTIAGNMYSLDENSKSSLLSMIESNIGNATIAREFLTMLAVCHTVIPEGKEPGDIQYHAASPDERALVEGARDLGFIFETRTPDYVIIDAMGNKEKYEILHVLEFSSARKRMSAVVRTPDGKIKLYCKGADTVICERLGNSQALKDVTMRHLEEFATEGLRTLCYASADIANDFYEKWRETFYEASTAMQFRERKLEDAAHLIEQNLTLLGATAIEDRLQDGVPETIASLLKAGIHVWVLTGDKQETAINIGHSSRLLTPGIPLVILNADSLDETREIMARNLPELGHEKDNDAALIIDGKTLIYALTPELRKEFMNLCISCKSVICCRVSPSQKAEVVELVSQETGGVTLAIGDGANDVAMIQKANVGIGIAGLEGLQAACASDYSIGQFRFLARLLFVHGAWNYSRLSKVILYSFYKNICLYVIELWFAAFSGWSGQVIFERWTIAMYNVLFTSASPLIMGIFDRSCSAATRMKFPELYRESQSGSTFNCKVFLWWVFMALWHSLVVFFLPFWFMMNDTVWSHGKTGDYLVVGNAVYTYTVVVVCLKAGLEMNAWTSVTHWATWGSIGLWFLFIIMYSNFWPILPMASNMCGMYLMVFSSPVFWLGLIVTPLAALLLDMVSKVCVNIFCKSVTEHVRESEIKNTDVANVLISKQRLTETARLLKNVFRRTSTRVNLEVELSHGFAFSQEEDGVVRQSEVIRAYDTTQPKPHGM